VQVSKLFGLSLGILAAIGGFVDIGDLVFNTAASATFGYQLMWVIPVGVLGIIVYSEMCGRVAAVSGKAVFDAIRERVGFNAALGALVNRCVGSREKSDPRNEQAHCRVMGPEARARRNRWFRCRLPRENQEVGNGNTSTASSTDSAVRRLEDLIANCLPALAPPGGDPPEYQPPISSITSEEAQGFFRAIDAGIFDLSDKGRCRPRGMRPSTGYCYPLLERPDKAKNTVRLWREWLTHAAAPAALHLDDGYPLHDIALDVGAFDVLVYSPLNQPLVAVEVKKTSAELDAMLKAMRALERQRWELKYDARLSNAEQKFRSLLALRPEFFLAIAPGVERAYAVSYPDDRTIPTLELSAIERIPSAQPLSARQGSARPVS
jgi:hypothetical protein